MDRFTKLIYTWNCNLINGLKISDYLREKQIKNVAIYGMGYIGRLLADELLNEEFEVICAIDKNPQIKHNRIIVSNLDETYNKYKFNFECIINMCVVRTQK